MKPVEVNLNSFTQVLMVKKELLAKLVRFKHKNLNKIEQFQVLKSIVMPTRKFYIELHKKQKDIATNFISENDWVQGQEIGDLDVFLEVFLFAEVTNKKSSPVEGCLDTLLLKQQLNDLSSVLSSNKRFYVSFEKSKFFGCNTIYLKETGKEYSQVVVELICHKDDINYFKELVRLLGKSSW